jgi:acyl carrier protein
MATTLDRVKMVLANTLGLGARADRLTDSTPLLGGIPEFDSLAVVSVVSVLEEEFDFTVTDDEVTTEVFETVGSLARFADEKSGR